MLKKHSIIIALCILPFLSNGQYFFRVNGDFTIKESFFDGSTNLIMGQFYYDINQRTLLYHINFPSDQSWLLNDSLIYKVEKDSIISKTAIPNLIEYNFFGLILSNKLHNYGLDKSFYSIKEIEEDQGATISTWQATDENIQKKSGDIIMMHKDNLLQGAIFKNTENKINSKQHFSNYQNLNGLQFPKEIIQYFYNNEGQEGIKLSTFTKIVLNNTTDETYFNFDVSQLPFTTRAK